MAEEKGLLDILGSSEEQKSFGKTKMSLGGIMDIASSFVEYNSLKTDAKNYDIQAREIQLQSKQRANQIRQQFLQAAGSYSYNAARRGVSVNSASVKSNLQNSAVAMGEDMQIQEQNANLQASALRQKGKIAKRSARTQHVTGLIDTTRTMLGGFGG